MKNLIFALLVLGLGIFSPGLLGQSYQRWIVWENQPAHIATPNEMADIFLALYQKKIFSGERYQVDGITFVISNPNLYLVYLKKCIKKSDPSLKTNEEMELAIRNGDVVRWGNDISGRVKNYWMTPSGSITFTPNYTGMHDGVDVLIINGNPTIKMDCGNPLEVYESSLREEILDISGRYKPELKSNSETTIRSGSLRVDFGSFVSPKNYGEDKPFNLNFPEEEISSLKKRRKVSTFGKIAIGFGTAVLAGTVAYLILKNNPPKSSSGGGGKPVTPGGHDDGANGGPITNGGH